MPTNKNLSVWIEVDGKPLAEYGVKILKEENIIECWVPSELNKPFEICVYDNIRSYSTAFDVRIDGNDIPCGRVIVKSNEETQCPSTRVKGYRLTKRTIQSFFFSKCILIDAESYNPFVSGRVGQIEVEVEQVRLKKTKATPRKKLTIAPLFLNERSHKNIDHGVQVGEEVQYSIDPHPTFLTQRIRPLATFIFKYRPMEVLRANGITPAIRRPTTTSIATEIIDLTAEDAYKLYQRVEELEGIVTLLEQQITNLNGQLEHVVNMAH